MRAAFIQNNPAFGKKEQNFREIESLSKDLSADLLVLPELFATGYTFQSREEAREAAETAEGETGAFLMELADRIGGAVAAGFAERDGSRLFNSAALVSKEGVLAIYRKIHLFNKETLFFTTGDHPPEVFELSGFRVGIMICFDWIFPETARTLALKGADVIAHPANLVLPWCQNSMVTRCLENRVFAVTANRIGEEVRGEDSFRFTGGSQITGTKGEILKKAATDRTAVGVVEFNQTDAREKNLNPYNNLLLDRRPNLYTLDREK